MKQAKLFINNKDQLEFLPIWEQGDYFQYIKEQRERQYRQRAISLDPFVLLLKKLSKNSSCEITNIHFQHDDKFTSEPVMEMLKRGATEEELCTRLKGKTILWIEATHNTYGPMTFDAIGILSVNRHLQRWQKLILKGLNVEDLL